MINLFIINWNPRNLMKGFDLVWKANRDKP